MNKQVVTIMENTLIIAGVSISLPMIESILGIIILAFQIVLIVIKTGSKIYEKIKQKKYDEIDDVVEESQKELDSLSGKDKHE